MADINDCLVKCLAERGGPTPIPPRPPSLYLETLLEEAAGLVRGDAALQDWMRAVGLDQEQDEDCLVAVGLVVSVPRQKKTTVSV